ncbi:hypothetical protein L209DRAFT_249683 [Thermothelomyces heterothallicus CBS 203.75]
MTALDSHASDNIHISSRCWSSPLSTALTFYPSLSVPEVYHPDRPCVRLLSFSSLFLFLSLFFLAQFPSVGCWGSASHHQPPFTRAPPFFGLEA